VPPRSNNNVAAVTAGDRSISFIYLVQLLSSQLDLLKNDIDVNYPSNTTPFNPFFCFDRL
jgi:hypothetical protein